LKAESNIYGLNVEVLMEKHRMKANVGTPWINQSTNCFKQKGEKMLP